MQGDITVKAPVALLFVVVLVGSLMFNVMHFMQPQGGTLGPMGATGVPASASGQNALLPNGQPNPLAHYPSNPADAVGMPNATGK